MTSESFVIDKDYDFGAIGSGMESTVTLHVQCRHDEVMELGEYFMADEKDEDLNENEIHINFRFKDELDEAEAARIAQDLFEEWQDSLEEDEEESHFDGEECEDEGDFLEEEEEKTVDDFFDMAYEYFAEYYYYYTWSPEFKNDCIDYSIISFHHNLFIMQFQ